MTDRPSRSTPRSPTARSTSKWDSYKFDAKLVNPANQRKYEIIVVGTGLAGASAAATLGRAGLQGEGLHLPRLAPPGPLDRRPGRHQRRQELPGRRRQHLPPLLRHGEGRRLPLPRGQRVPAGRRCRSTSSTSASPRACRSPASTAACSTTARFGGAQVSRTFYARGQTGQQLLLGAYQALARQIGARQRRALQPHRAARRRRGRRHVRRHRRPRPAHRRDRRRTRRTPSCSPPAATRNAFFLSTNAMACNVTAIWRAHRRGALFANPCYTQIHPTCIPQSDEFQSKLTLMSESLRNDGRIWVPKNPDDTRSPDQIPEDERDYFLERRYPSFGNLAPRDIAVRAAKVEVDSGKGVGPLKNGVYLDFADAIGRLGERRHRGALREPLRDVRAHHRRGPVRACRCASTRRRTTRWAGSGSTTS